MSISKELFTEVMGKEKMYCILNIDTGEIEPEQYFNIHELAHKCKEWIWDNEYLYEVEQKGVYGYLRPDYRVKLWCTREVQRFSHQDPETPCEYFDEHTEPEALFKACQWILDNKEEN